MTDRIAFGAAVADQLDRHGHLAAASHDDKVKAAAAIFDELHQWAAEKFPMGAGAQVSEQSLKYGMKAVRAKMARMDDQECQEKYGVPILLILGLIPTLVSWMSMLWKWWKGES